MKIPSIKLKKRKMSGKLNAILNVETILHSCINDNNLITIYITFYM